MHLYHKEIAGMFIVERFVAFGKAPTFHVLAMQVFLRTMTATRPPGASSQVCASARCVSYPEPPLRKGHAIHAPTRYLYNIYYPTFTIVKIQSYLHALYHW